MTLSIAAGASVLVCCFPCLVCYILQLETCIQERFWRENPNESLERPPRRSSSGLQPSFGACLRRPPFSLATSGFLLSRINGTGIDLMVWIQLTGAVSKMHPLLASKIFHSSVPHQL
ncbi:hypothetical protein, variant 2 [Blastomyces dermatitidis ER-3]|uniref:Secreted protein n=1 Tax=Ajellomyces dermatitidis (strain ER-3 / ATCC MYA-2586) TaxID=559297 RepID=A0ABX2VVU6_AJEDR|nr:uncharacterized protein BDCG_04799 [Blastomyces dermatitidis ER-3]XP_045281013.1 hypothetical protein, variant 1 [Blastomyces dermatitidis ER-3]XP_045281014.1 hypothetical protein, variant 2 [Blastomyces dermatitidis ER-3]OAT01285.1 hypothetical protein BDCG_04799 [Blastomyces dermatitidis ER-3]OAT01286.1 hypothetical protein, variant 1 [Blastomyces dermatitidis ER-3]OAT01287.1 hypothetical protein, variant 2 [Blastomyces dermatitidis ER-3]